MRRPVSTPRREKSVEVAVASRVIGDAVLPAAPEDTAPGAPERADRVWVVLPAAAGVGVDLRGPGMPVPGRVGEHAEVPAQALVAGPAEGSRALLAGLD